MVRARAAQVHRQWRRAPPFPRHPEALAVSSVIPGHREAVGPESKFRSAGVMDSGFAG
jgi:hypothetical protein